MEAVLSQHGIGNGSALIKHLPHPRTSITSPTSALCPETTSASFSYPSVQFNRSLMSNFLPPHGLQHTRLPCPSPTPGVYANRLLSRWCHPTISILCRPRLFLPSILPSIFPSLFKWVSSSHQVAKILEFQLQHQSFQWIFRTDFP